MLAVPESKVAAARQMLEAAGDLAAVIGRVVEEEDGKARLAIL